MGALDILKTIAMVWKKLVTREWELHPRAYHIIIAHVMGVQGAYFLLSGQVPLPYFICGVALIYISAIGVAAGAHRLWSHRSYKAKLPLRILLMLAQTFAGQDSLYCWARHHRLHHKYSETDADPHNVSRGIFFTHIGWAMLKEHPEVTKKEKTIDFSDLHNDPVVAFQHKYFIYFDIILYHLFPILFPYFMWLPSLYMCVCLNYLRFLISYHVSSLGNSVAHTWIRKPYEKSIGPADVTWLSLLIVGEGWHNFHHVFPWDYRSTDVGLYVTNLATMFIDLMAKIGWAYDLKAVPDHVIRKRAARTGDGSHPSAHLVANPNDDNDNNNNNETEKIFEENNNEVISSPESGYYEHTKIKTDFNGNECDMNEDDLSIDKLDVGDIGPAPWGWGDDDIPEDEKAGTIIKHAQEKVN